ncbi:hypothetical protein MIDIC_70037 [Alphaproteobacteria bacterium]
MCEPSGGYEEEICQGLSLLIIYLKLIRKMQMFGYSISKFFARTWR